MEKFLQNLKIYHDELFMLEYNIQEIDEKIKDITETIHSNKDNYQDLTIKLDKLNLTEKERTLITNVIWADGIFSGLVFFLLIMALFLIKLPILKFLISFGFTLILNLAVSTFIPKLINMYFKHIRFKNRTQINELEETLNNINSLNITLKTSYDSLIKKKQRLTFLYTKKQEIYQAAREEFITKYGYLLDEYLKNHGYYEKEFILSLKKRNF